MMTGAEILIDALKREGVDTIFGYPGGVVLSIFDVLFRTPEIRLILTRHEQAAAHAADGYARATGRTGVCLVTSGPGATNTITGPGQCQARFRPDRRHQRPGPDRSPSVRTPSRRPIWPA